MSSERYPACIRHLHWMVAAGVAVQLTLGWGSETIGGDAGMRLLRIHFQLGMVLLVLMLLRLACRWSRRMPSAASEVPCWQRRVARAVHATLYLLLFLLPASGYVIWVWMAQPLEVLGVVAVPRLFVPPAEDETWRAVAWYVHVGSVWGVVILVVLHVAAALWHPFVLRDRWISRRML